LQGRKIIDKTTTLQSAISAIHDGASVMVGGFGVPGTPFTLIDGLLELGVRDLTLIKNDANEAGMGISVLIEAGRVRKLVTTHLGLNATAIEMANNGKIEVEFLPQGILAEKIRARGAGLPAILTDIGIDTILRDNRRVVRVDERELLVEPALGADFALIHAAVADRRGNLVFEKSARNFSPLMATAATTVIVEAEHLVATGDLDPDGIHTPGLFIDHIVELNELSADYKVRQAHVV
jgi:acetate CoA/acetoacetate CoA-transferase alpha subunit